VFECEVEITGHREVVAGTFLMTLRAPSIAGGAGPGQFVMVQAGSGLDPLLRRPFSICGLYGGTDLGVLYRVVGRGTAVLARKRPGERVRVLGPLGRGFSVESDPRPLLLVGGGMGVAPLLFLAQALSSRGGPPFRLLTGFSGKENVISPRDVLGADIRARVATDDGTAGHAGPVTDLLPGELKPGGKEETAPGVCACGPAAMLKRTAELARTAGAPCQVSLEASMACGLGACLGCVVHAAPGAGAPFLRVCTEGPVLGAEAVDWDRLGTGVRKVTP
jgi:dihydroorotate dehydrogenase electron transfer subunit